MSGGLPTTGTGEVLYEHHHLRVDVGQGLLRIDKYLQLRLSAISRSRLQRSIRSGFVRVGGVVVKANYKVRPQDDIRVYLPVAPRDTTVRAEDMDLELVYEDDTLLVVNKPAGLVVHPAHGNWTGTLLNGLMGYLSRKEEKALTQPHLVHRLDKDTSGLLLVAKHEDAQAALWTQFFHHQIERAYYALVWGVPSSSKGTIEAPLRRSARDRRVMEVCKPPKGKHAMTHYEVLECYQQHAALVLCRLETGRTHQIRAHMKHIGHPLFGDPYYGGDKILRGQGSKYKRMVQLALKLRAGQALHAFTLAFEHPEKKQKMTFQSPFPNDMSALIHKWRTYSGQKPHPQTRNSTPQYHPS